MRKATKQDLVHRVIEAVPGKRIFGLYRFVFLIRFLPFFFALGAALEFSMINWTVGETNFYSVYKKRQALEYVEQKRREEEQQ